MANDILTSIRGRRLGLDSSGRLLSDPQGRGTQPVQSVLYSNVAASTALSNFTAQRAFDTDATIPANSLQAGRVICIRYQGIQTAGDPDRIYRLKRLVQACQHSL